VILVALIVLVVPELLSGPWRSAPHASEEPGEPPLRSYTLPLNDGPSTAVAQPGMATLRSGEGTTTLQPDEPTSPVRPSAATATLQSGAATATLPSGAATRTATVQTGAAAATVRRRAGTAAAAAPKRQHAAAAPSTESGWRVQVGSFDSRDHADRLAHQLKGKGFSASVSLSTSHGRKWYRVRVGPERDRTAALAMARRLRAAGEPAVVQRP
jgi:DedD protein